MREERSSLLGGADTTKYYGSSPSSPPTATSPSSHSNIVGTTTPLTPTINTSRRSSIAAMAAAADAKARRKSSVQMKTLPPALPYNIPKPLIEVPSMESLEVDEAVQQRMNNFHNETNSNTSNRRSSSSSSSSSGKDNNILKVIHNIISQLPAIAIASILNFMVCSERDVISLHTHIIYYLQKDKCYISCAISLFSYTFHSFLLFFVHVHVRLAYHSGHPTSQQNYHYQGRKCWDYVCFYSQHW